MKDPIVETIARLQREKRRLEREKRRAANIRDREDYEDYLKTIKRGASLVSNYALNMAKIKARRFSTFGKIASVSMPHSIENPIFYHQYLLIPPKD